MPIRPLRLGVARYGLNGDIVHSSVFGGDNPPDWAPFLTTAAQPSINRMAIHWCNEWVCHLGFDKTKPLRGSLYEQLLIRHNIIA